MMGRVLFLIIAVFTILTSQIMAVESFFTNGQLIFDNGAGFVATDNACGSYGVSANGKVRLSNAIVLDDLYDDIEEIGKVLTGIIVAFGIPEGQVETDRDGWIPCDGRTISVTGEPCELQRLANKIGTTYGGTLTPAWSGSTSGVNYTGTFQVPDLRGYFIRGVDSFAESATGVSPVAAGRDDSTRYSNANLTGATSTDTPNTYQGDSVTHSHNLTGVSHTLTGDVTYTHSHNVSSLAVLGNRWYTASGSNRTGSSQLTRTLDTSSHSSNHNHYPGANMTHVTNVTTPLAGAVVSNFQSQPKNAGVIFYIKK